jgi:hypothetical protein
MNQTNDLTPRIVEKTLSDGSTVHNVRIRNFGTVYQFDAASQRDAEAIVALFDTGAVVDVSHDDSHNESLVARAAAMHDSLTNR